MSTQSITLSNKINMCGMCGHIMYLTEERFYEVGTEGYNYVACISVIEKALSKIDFSRDTLATGSLKDLNLLVREARKVGKFRTLSPKQIKSLQIPLITTYAQTILSAEAMKMFAGLMLRTRIDEEESFKLIVLQHEIKAVNEHLDVVLHELSCTRKWTAAALYAQKLFARKVGHGAQSDKETVAYFASVIGRIGEQ